MPSLVFPSLISHSYSLLTPTTTYSLFHILLSPFSYYHFHFEILKIFLCGGWCQCSWSWGTNDSCFFLWLCHVWWALANVNFLSFFSIFHPQPISLQIPIFAYSKGIIIPPCASIFICLFFLFFFLPLTNFMLILCPVLFKNWIKLTDLIDWIV